MPLRMTQPPFFTVVCKRKDLPFIVGRADRVAICRKLRQPIRSNCGLGPKPRCCHDGVALSLSVGWQGLNPINVPNIIESYPSGLHFVPRSHRRPSSCRVSIALSTQAFKAGAIKRFYMAGEIDSSVISLI